TGVQTCALPISAGSTRRAISTNVADNASGARAVCNPSWATAGRPARIAPIPTPVSKHTAAIAMIQTRSLRSILDSASVVCLKDSNMIHHLANLEQRKGYPANVAIFGRAFREV